MNTITTVDGEQLVIHPVSYREIIQVRQRVEAEFRERGEPIDPPTYTVKTEVGPQTYTHDETTVETDEEKAIWKAHQDALTRLTVARSQAVSELIILKALRIRSVPDEWIEEQKLFGIPVPENQRERLLAYAESRFLQTPKDIATLVNAVIQMALTGSVTEAEVKAAEESFRSPLDTGERAAADAGRVESRDETGDPG